ncbi:hypothetical protein [Vibrio phage vB_VcM_SY]
MNMITRKEDLHNTWIKNDRGELRDLYISVAKSFGINDETCTGGLEFIGIFSEWGGCGFVGNSSKLLLDQESRKQLTIQDLKKEKPTPTKFVKVEESIFDLKAEFERGELYQKPEFARDYSAVSNAQALAGALNGGFCYRQVEIDWRDEVVKFLNDDNIGDSGPIKGSLKGEMSDIDWDYFAESDFIEMCHIVASLTEKPEGV